MRQSPLYEASMVYAITVAFALLVYLGHWQGISYAIDQTLTLATLLGMPAFSLWAIAAWILRNRGALERFVSELVVTGLLSIGGVGFVLSQIQQDTTHSAADQTLAYNHWLLLGWTFGIGSVLGAVFLHFVLPVIQNRRSGRNKRSK